MTGVEAFAAAIDELEAGGGTEDFEILGAEAFEAAGWATEGFGTDGLGLLAGFFCIAFLGALALPLPLAPASFEAFVALLNSSTAFWACLASLA
jgi:hypothetical protein